MPTFSYCAPLVEITVIEADIDSVTAGKMALQADPPCRYFVLVTSLQIRAWSLPRPPLPPEPVLIFECPTRETLEPYASGYEVKGQYFIAELARRWLDDLKNPKTKSWLQREDFREALRLSTHVRP